MDDTVFWVLLGLAAVFGVPTLAIIAFARSSSNRREIAELRLSLAALQKQVAELRAGEAPAPRTIIEHVSPPKPEPVVIAAAPPPEIKIEPPKPTQPATPIHPQPAPAKPKSNLEETVTSSWMVWLGAIAVALAGVFLVKYAIDNQLLGPTARVSLGLLLGLVLAAGGEFLRRKPLQRAIAAIRPDYVPSALTASGLFIAFASIYAAYSVYALVPPLVAFALLAIVALAAVGLSLLQGRLVALLGLLGAFITPALIATHDSSIWAMFTYLLVVELACLAVTRYRAWWWLAFATLAGVIGWALLVIFASPHITDMLPTSLFLLFSAVGFFAMRWGMESPSPQETLLAEIRHFDISERAVAFAGCAIAVALYLLADAAHYNTASLIVAGLAAALYLFFGRREGPYDGLAVVGAAMVLAIVATMPVPEAIAPTQPLTHAPLVPQELSYFYIVAGAFAALFGIAGFVALWGARRPAIWAGVSAGVPVLLLAIAYWRIVDFGADTAWAGVAVALAAIALIAAERVERYRTARGLDVSLGFYAAAVVASLSLAAAMMLRDAWLTVALSIQLPALGFISRRIPARAIRILAGIVVGVVLVRLALNYDIVEYTLGRNAPLNWLIYGYGIPSIACFGAAYLFRKNADDALVTALQAAGLAFAVLLVSLELRLLIAGAIDADSYSLLEESLQSITWLAVGTGLAVHGTRVDNRVSRYGSKILLGAAAVQIVLLQLFASNPLYTGEAVGHYPLLNVLMLAYLIPALFAFRLAISNAPADIPRQKEIAAIAGLLLVLAYISLEVRRAFHGPILNVGATTDAELYTYSAAWLVYAGVLLTLGFIQRQALLRYAGLAMLLIVSLKVFLIDMGDLTGLYRVASFLGLGLVLIGIGYIYQRFMRPADSPPAA